MPADATDFVDDLAPLDPLLPITPKTAVAKFLVDMRLIADRAWRPWNKVFTEALVECALPSRARQVILDLHPVEDYFFAGVVAQQAYRIRTLYPFSVAEALMRELALQLDAAVGRSDSSVSNLAFIILGRIRKARAAQDGRPVVDGARSPRAAEDGRPSVDGARSPRAAGNCRDHDQAVEAILERIGVGANSATSEIMNSLAMRHRLAEPLAMAPPLWWDTFGTIYAVDARVLKPLPRRIDGGRGESVRADGWADRWRAAARAARPTTASPFSFGAWLRTMREPPGPEQRPD